jgi:outer membrane murein-binding lipoprotein Lpp
MAKKIYLSAAAHATDNPTKSKEKCGENIHCNEYMDIVEKRLKNLGFDVKRGDKSKTGSTALQSRVAEANEWGADIYYAAHTNAGGGRYSMTMCYPDSASKKKAQVFHKYRKCVSSHKVTTRSDLYEINATKMPCMYDELFFHDNATDCKWFHEGGMEKLAEETVHALCELCGVTYKAPSTDNAKVKELESKVKALQSENDSLEKEISNLNKEISNHNAKIAELNAKITAAKKALS